MTVGYLTQAIEDIRTKLAGITNEPVTIDRARFERLREAVLYVLDVHPDAALDVLDIIRDGDTKPLP